MVAKVFQADAVLALAGMGEIRVQAVRTLLADVENAYNRSSLFLAATEERALDPEYWTYTVPRPDRWRHRRAPILSDAEVEATVPSRERLVLRAVRLESPGTWEFLGKLNPLEVVRQYLADRHERRKDKSYREAAERKRLELENALLANRVVSERIEIAKKVGLTDRDLAPLINDLLLGPLARLDQHQDRGVIETATLRELPPGEGGG